MTKPTKIKFDMTGEAIDTAVNRIFQILQHEIKLNIYEACFVCMTAKNHLENLGGFKIERTLFTPKSPEEAQ